VAERKKAMIESNMKTFGNVSIGIHGKELPKFADHPALHQYWKAGNSTYIAEPGVKSRVELTQTRKYWAKPDAIYLSDVNGETAPPDPFKTTHVALAKKPDVCPKVNEVNLFTQEPEDPACSFLPKRQARWTSTVQRYAADSPTVLAQPTDKRVSAVKKEQQPLYSSFSPNEEFVDPISKTRDKASY
jgi:hypothetical protein